MTAKKYSKLTNDLLNEIISKYVQGHMDGFEKQMIESNLIIQLIPVFEKIHY